MNHNTYFFLAAIASWLAYHAWRFLWRVSSSQPEAVQLPRLYPVFPTDGSKGDTTVDIIAVHGIETTSPKTWIAYEQDTEPKGRPYNWLKDADMLPSVIEGARIWVFDYNTNYSHNAQKVRVDGLAVTLLNCIKDRHNDFKSRKIVFIGSCFGGIVVAEALLTASSETEDERKKAVFNQTAGVIFLGSPLRGTKAATFAGWKNFVYGILRSTKESSNTLIADIQENSSRLENSVAGFAKLTVRRGEQIGMEIRCFYETRTTQMFNSIIPNWLIKPKEIVLVERGSACLDCHEHIPLNVRHTMMNKYRGPEDSNFKFVSSRIKDIIDKITTDRSLTPDQQKCMQALSFPYQDQKDMNPKRIDRTCEWFFQHPMFFAWRQETTANLLWVTAGPGCGKSVLARALVDEGLLHSDNPDTKTTSICYFFFKDDVESGSGVNALRSILHQLFLQKPWLIQYAELDRQAPGPWWQVNAPEAVPFEKLWDILIKAADANASPVICVFDALDECEPSKRKSLIEHISKFYRDSTRTSPKLKFIVTSRPFRELEVEFKVNDLPSIHLDGNEMSETISKEVNLVISHKISRISKHRWPPLNDKTKDGLIQYLQGQNNRTYLWVHLMLDEISRSLESTEQNFVRLLSTIPLSVDDAYEKILKRATKIDAAKRVLRLVLAAERPLTLKEMNIALEILVIKERGENCTSEENLKLDKEEIFRKKIEDLCGLFVSVVDQKIYLIHQTAKEFLTSRNGDTNTRSPSCWKHTFPLEESHLEALKACLWYLQLEFPDIALDRLRYIESSQLAQDYPFLLYASINWTLHFQQAGKKADKGIGGEALQLCKTTSQEFSLWYRVFKKHRYISLKEQDSSDLSIACYFGLTNAVQLLLEESSIDVDVQDNMGRTPLQWAALKGHEAIVKLLLDTGKVNADAQDKNGGTPLWRAAYNGYEAIVKLLLDTGKVNADAQDNIGRTPLWWAASDGHEAIVKLLLNTGKVNANAQDNEGQTPLWWAASDGHEAIVKLLLDTGKVNADAQDNYSRTPLWWATYIGHKAIVKLLLDTGKVNADAQDKNSQTPLWRAAYNGYEAIVKLLLDTGKVNADAQDKNSQTPLWWAASDGHEAIVKLLLDTGKVNADAQDNEGQTPLWRAALKGDEAIVKLLLDTGKVNADAQDKNSQTPLWSAASKGHEAIVKLLLDTSKVNADAQDSEGQTPLWRAASKGDEAIVKLLLDTGKVNADAQDKNSQTPLWSAASKGHEAIVKLLLNTGKVNADAQDKNSQTPLWRAASKGHEAIVKLLLDTSKVNADAQDKNGQTPLWRATKNGHKIIVKMLLDTGKVNADAQDNEGETPLQWAALKGHEAIVKLLLNTGKVNADAQDNYSQTPLWRAAYNGHEAIVKLLLDTGKVNANAQDQNSRTPLWWAASDGHEAIVKLLLDTGKVNADAQDNEGETPLWRATYNGYEAIVKLLLDTGKVNADAQDNIGRTPLWWAAMDGHEAIVKLLLNTGKVNANAQDNEGQTPLWWAASDGHEAIVKLLLDTGKVNADAQDNEGQTPLWRAAYSGYEAIVKLLLNTSKVNADVQDKNGQTPLWSATKNGHKIIVKMLLDTGKVDTDVKNDEGFW